MKGFRIKRDMHGSQVAVTRRISSLNASPWDLVLSGDLLQRKAACDRVGAGRVSRKRLIGAIVVSG